MFFVFFFAGGRKQLLSGPLESFLGVINAPLEFEIQKPDTGNAMLPSGRLLFAKIAVDLHPIGICFTAPASSPPRWQKVSDF